jgi:hypothetical protein
MKGMKLSHSEMISIAAFVVSVLALAGGEPFLEADGMTFWTAWNFMPRCRRL